MNTGRGRPRPRKGDHILLVDRCLAPEVAYEICKLDGLHGIPLRDHYGDVTAQALEDITFLTEAGQAGLGRPDPESSDVAGPSRTRLHHREPCSGLHSTTPTRARPSRASSWVGTCSRSVDASGDPTPVPGDSGCREFGKTSHDRVQPSGGRRRATAPPESRFHATVAAPRADQPRSWLQPESGPSLDGGCDLGRGRHILTPALTHPSRSPDEAAHVRSVLRVQLRTDLPWTNAPAMLSLLDLPFEVFESLPEPTVGMLNWIADLNTDGVPTQAQVAEQQELAQDRSVVNAAADFPSGEPSHG